MTIPKPVRFVGAALLGLSGALLIIWVLTPQLGDLTEPPPLPKPIGNGVEPQWSRAFRPRDGGVSLKPSQRISHARLKEVLADPPKQQSRVSVGEQLVANRLPMVIDAVETEASDVEVLEHYAREFDRLKLPWDGVKTTQQFTAWPAISATDIDGMYSWTVIAMRHEDGKGTTVLLGLGDLEGLAQRDDEETAGLPRYPGSEPSVLHSFEDGRATVLVSFDTADKPDQVAGFYKEVLGAQGYAAAPGDEGSVSERAFVGPNGRSWRVRLSRREGATQVAAWGAP